MNARHLIAFAVLASMVGTSAFAAGIEVDFDPDARFTEYRTFRLVDLSDAPASATGVISNPGAREDVDRRLAAELGRRDLRPAGEGEEPDLVVRWWTGIGKTKQVDKIGGYGLFYDGYWSSIWVTMQKQTVGKGVFVVDLIDAKSGELAWRAYLPVKIDDPVDTRKRFVKQIQKGLSKYPPSESDIRRRRAEREKSLPQPSP